METKTDEFVCSYTFNSLLNTCILPCVTVCAVAYNMAKRYWVEKLTVRIGG